MCCVYGVLLRRLLYCVFISERDGDDNMRNDITPYVLNL